jgi:hypothetical protein
MKQLILLFTLISSSLFAQDSGWFQTGSTWTYNYTVPPILIVLPPEILQAQYTITEQTELNGQPCAKMEAIGDDPNPMYCNVLSAPYYVYESNDSIFFANDFDNTFRLVYYFGAEQGDTWDLIYTSEYNEGETVHLVTVDSVYSRVIDGVTLKVMDLSYEYVSGNDQAGIMRPTATVTERLGASEPFSIIFGYRIQGLCEAYYNEALQCYTDPEISYLSPDFQSCTLGLNDPQVSSNIEISPNPANDFINIQSLDSPISEIRIYNVTGQLVFSEKIQKQEHLVNTSKFESGIYLISIETEQGIGVKKLVVE